MTELKAASGVKWTQINCVVVFLFCRTYIRSYRIGVANAGVKQLVSSEFSGVSHYFSCFSFSITRTYYFYTVAFKLLLVDIIYRSNTGTADRWPQTTNKQQATGFAEPIFMQVLSV